MVDEQYPPPPPLPSAVPPSPGRPGPPPADDDVWPAHAWYHSWFVVLLVLAVCGPVGLVLLWSSPYSRGWKVAVTVGVVVVYAVALAIPSRYSLPRSG